MEKALVDLKRSEQERKRVVLVYGKENEMRQQEILKLKTEIQHLKAQNQALEESVKIETERRVSEFKEMLLSDKQKLKEELNSYIEKYKKHKERKIAFREKLAKSNEERDKINEAFYTNNKINEEKLEKTRFDLQTQIDLLKKKEDIYLKENAKILESDMYRIYKETQGKYESKLKECVEIKNERDSESKIKEDYRHDYENNKKMLENCINKQVDQKELIKAFEKENSHLKEQLESVREEFKQESARISDFRQAEMEETRQRMQSDLLISDESQFGQSLEGEQETKGTESNDP